MFKNSNKSFKKGYQFNSFCESITYNDSDVSIEDSNLELKKNVSELRLSNNKLLKENKLNKMIISELRYDINNLKSNNLKLLKRLESNSEILFGRVLKIYLTGTFFFAFTIGSFTTFVFMKGL